MSDWTDFAKEHHYLSDEWLEYIIKSDGIVSDRGYKQICQNALDTRKQNNALAAENERLRDALNELLTAANQVSEPNEFWEMATEYGPYGSFYKTNWYDSETPADKLAYGIDKAREALGRE